MVIECPACKTKFKLPDDKVGPTGVSVRCSKCATTFAVRPPAAAQPEPAERTMISVPQLPPEPPPPAAPAPDPFASNAASGFSTPPATPEPEADPFGSNAASGFGSPPSTPVSPPATPTVPSVAPPSAPTNPSAAAPPPAKPAAVPGFGGMSSAFAAGMAATGGAPPAAPAADPFPGAAPMSPSLAAAGFGTPFPGVAMPASSAPMDDPSTIGDEGASSDAQPGVNESLKASLLGSNAPGTSLTDEGETGLTRDPAAGPASFDFGGGDANPFATPPPSSGPQPAPPPAELFARPTPVPQPSGPAPEASIDTVAPTGPAAEKKARPDKKSGKKSQRLATAPAIARPAEPARAYRLLLALFFVGAFASAFASLTDGSFDPHRLDRGRLSLLIGPPEAVPGIEGLAITARRGSYVMTAPGKPRLYTANGVAINEGAAAKGYLEVRGRILDAGGGVLAETTAPCGNSFRDDQLLGFRSGDELRRAYLPGGDAMTNAKLEPGAAVACSVVFFEAPAPEKTAAFELEIVSAQPAS